MHVILHVKNKKISIKAKKNIIFKIKLKNNVITWYLNKKYQQEIDKTMVALSV